MADQNDQFPTREPLPPELEPLHRRLLDDGAHWRAGLPSTERLEQRLNSLAQQERYMRLIVPTENRPGRLSLIYRVKGKHEMFQGRLKTALAVATIAAVVVLFVVLFYGFAGHTTRTAGGTQPGTSTNAATNHQYDKYVPIVAPSNPKVIYKLVPASDQSLLVRSTDGGATWQTFSLPTVTGGKATPLTAFVSPLNPQDVFLTVIVQLSSGGFGPQPCPNSVASGGLSSYAVLSGGSPYCAVEFLSKDGGAHWSQVHLPADAAPGALGDTSGYVFPSALLFSNGTTVFHVQGNRLYSTTNVLPGSPPNTPEAQSTLTTRIVVSTDGGLNWSYADAALVSSSQNICDYTATPSGSTLFAVTAVGCNSEIAPPTFLWRSDDAGAHWTEVGQLPGNAELGMIAVSRGDGQAPLLYIDMAKETCTSTPYLAMPYAGGCGVDASPTNVQVSADGGKTWQSAPTKGFPTGQNNTLQSPGAPLGVLSDGSVLFLGSGAQSSSSFYTWKLGDTSWHRVGPGFNSVVAAFVVSGASNTVCVVTASGLVYDVHTFHN
jgi:hypothetical protein